MSPSKTETLKLFVQCLNTVPDPRSKHGTHQPFSTILAIIFLGLIGNRNNPTAIARWTEQHFQTLKKFLPFGKRKGKIRAPCDHTQSVDTFACGVRLQQFFAEKPHFSPHSQ